MNIFGIEPLESEEVYHHPLFRRKSKRRYRLNIFERLIFRVLTKPKSDIIYEMKEYLFSYQIKSINMILSQNSSNYKLLYELSNRPISSRILCKYCISIISIGDNEMNVMNSVVLRN
jgi:hypothetical protein